MIASESVRWYLGADCDLGKRGDPLYSILGKNGNERSVTITDVRKHPEWEAKPSVTSILKLANNFGLNIWMQKQVCKAAWKFPRDEGYLDNYETWEEEILEEAGKESERAAERGTALHRAINLCLDGDKAYTYGGYEDHLAAINLTLAQHGISFGLFKSGQSFVCDLGYGGSLDAYQENIVPDFKSKDIIDDKEKMIYDQHVMQLAAYAHGIGLDLGKVRALNVFVGVDDKQVRIFEHTPEDLRRGLQMFLCLLNFWRAQTGLYD